MAPVAKSDRGDRSDPRNDEPQQSLPVWIVTGGAGFIGSCFVRQTLEQLAVRIVTVDRMTYAASLDGLPAQHDRHELVVADIGDSQTMRSLFQTHRPVAVVHLAAETHVDRSIDGPLPFLQSNVVGTCHLLEVAREYFQSLPPPERERFRFLHVSTDEVYGSISGNARSREGDPYAPNSPYAASKAAADCWVRAYHRTYGLPVMTTHCGNNYGPYQFPEKLIPLMVLNAAEGKPLPIYGDGRQIRNWIHVEDHCAALHRVLRSGRIGETYCVAGHEDVANRDLVERLAKLVERVWPQGDGRRTTSQIVHVPDRPGHDLRYALDSSKLRSETGWRPEITLDAGLEQTVRWYADHLPWVRATQARGYHRERLGLKSNVG